MLLTLFFDAESAPVRLQGSQKTVGIFYTLARHEHLPIYKAALKEVVGFVPLTRDEADDR
jgi:hypothetical protein